MILPKRLKKGDTIGVIAPSGHLREVNIDDVEKSLIDMGYNVKMYESCYSVDRGYLSGKDELRAKDLQDAFEDKNIDAVFCIRGGYGAARLLDLIDFDVIKNNPKIFLGLSDITALHIAFNQKCDLVTYHGPVGRRFVDMDEYTKESVFKNFSSLPSNIIILIPISLALILTGDFIGAFVATKILYELSPPNFSA